MTTDIKSKAIDWFLKQGAVVVILVAGIIYASERFGVPVMDAHEHYLTDMAEQQTQLATTQATMAETQADLAVGQRNIVGLLEQIRAEQLRRDRN